MWENIAPPLIPQEFDGVAQLRTSRLLENPGYKFGAVNGRLYVGFNGDKFFKNEQRSKDNFCVSIRCFDVCKIEKQKGERRGEGKRKQSEIFPAVKFYAFFFF